MLKISMFVVFFVNSSLGLLLIPGLRRGLLRGVAESEKTTSEKGEISDIILFNKKPAIFSTTCNDQT
jgi:hypothetical protein